MTGEGFWSGKYPRVLAGVAVVVLLVGLVFVVKNIYPLEPAPFVTTFGECAASYLVVGTQPRVCSGSGKTFYEYTGNQLQLDNEIRVQGVVAGSVISASPLVVSGEALEDWFQGGDVVVRMIADSGVVVGSAAVTLAPKVPDPLRPGASQANATEGFTAFEATVPFEFSDTSGQGALVFIKSDGKTSLVIPVVFNKPVVPEPPIPYQE